MENKVLKLLIKWGNSESDSRDMINNHFDLAVKCYPDAKASKLAEAIINF